MIIISKESVVGDPQVGASLDSDAGLDTLETATAKGVVNDLNVIRRGVIICWIPNELNAIPAAIVKDVLADDGVIRSHLDQYAVGIQIVVWLEEMMDVIVFNDIVWGSFEKGYAIGAAVFDLVIAQNVVFSVFSKNDGA